jgi:UDP-2-acetamido-2,6-beta-L-arabino-hexul-4-ose reductase
LKNDARGTFSELVKSQSGSQISFSTTRPNRTRGNHFHTRKIERFAVIKGEAVIRIRRVGSKEVIAFPLSGDKPSFVDMPVWYTHNITNTGSDELITIFCINEFYKENDPDTFIDPVQIEN